jgi:shikimate kinase
LKRIAGKNLVLIGFMGTGKTEAGRLLAGELNRRMVDTDELIEQREGMSIGDIFKKYGEPYFRKREQELICELAAQRGLVIATGGGIVLNGENVRILRDSGYLVWLDAEMGEVAARLAGDTTRPLLAGQGDSDVAKLYEQRQPLYGAAAHMRVSTTRKTPLAVVEEIIRVLAE